MGADMIHEDVSKDIIGAAMSVLNELKPGMDEKLYEREEKYLRERIDVSHEIVVADDVAKIPDAEVVSPFIYTKLTAELLARLPGLKLITTRSTGFDHIDVAECGRRGITVCNVPF